MSHFVNFKSKIREEKALNACRQETNLVCVGGQSEEKALDACQLATNLVRVHGQNEEKELHSC